MLGEFGKMWHPVVNRDKKNTEIWATESRFGLYWSPGKREERGRLGRAGVQGKVFSSHLSMPMPETQNHSHQVPLCVWGYLGGRTPAGTTHVTLIWRMTSESFTRQDSLGTGSALCNHIGLRAHSDSATS